MDYKGYYIKKNDYGFDWWLGGENDYYYDGEHDNANQANSIEEAGAQIDELILELQNISYENNS